MSICKDGGNTVYLHFGVPGITNYIPDRSPSKSILSQHKKFLSQVKVVWSVNFWLEKMGGNLQAPRLYI